MSECTLHSECESDCECMLHSVRERVRVTVSPLCVLENENEYVGERMCPPLFM